MVNKSVTWSEINQYQYATGKALTAWESRSIQAMSTAYIDQLGRSVEPTCPSPCITDNRTPAERRKAVQEALIRDFKKPLPKKRKRRK